MVSDLVCKLGNDCRIKIIGLGGVGGIVTPYLAMFVKSLGINARLVLIDGDAFEDKNNSRMRFGTIGNKVEVVAQDISQLIDSNAITVIPISEYITDANIENLVRDGDYVFLCVDNHPSRKLLSEHCAKLNRIALFSGGNDGVDKDSGIRGTYGNAQIYIRDGGKDITAPLTKFHREIANPKGKMPGDLSCAELANSVPQLLFTNATAAIALLNAFAAFVYGELAYQEVAFDSLTGQSVPQIPINGSAPQPW